jgi:hypothetical protein
MKTPKISKQFVSSVSFDKKSIPGGSPEPIALSASKKLSSVGASSLRSQAFTPESKFGKC